MLEVTTISAGYAGAPGYTVFHFDNGTLVDTQANVDGVVAAVRKFMVGWAGITPTGFLADVQSEVRSLNPGTGALIDIKTPTTPPAHVPGVGTGPYAAPCGLLVRWNAGTPAGRGHVRGRTFLVPVSAANYALDGGVIAGAVTGVTALATALITEAGAAGSPLVVWRRPKGGAGGFAAAVLSASLSPKVAVLTSRRS